MKFKFLLLSALLVPMFANCAPPSTDPTGGAGTTGGLAGTTGNTAGTTGDPAGTTGQTAGTTGNTAGTTGDPAGTTGQTAGTSGGGTGGTNAAGTTGGPGAGGRGGAAGTNAAGTTGQGGRGGAAGTNAAGTTGQGGRGGAAGTGAAGTGAAGTSAAGTGGAVDPNLVRDFFNGQAYYLNCGPLNGGTMRVCSNTNTLNGNTNLASTNHNHPMFGGLNRNDFATAPGTAGQTYCVTIRVQGIAEAKAYVNDVETARPGTHFGITGNVAFGTMTDASSDGTNGWVVGGMPTTAGDYNVYGFVVNEPRQVYYLNSINTSGTNRQNHTAYAFSYTASFNINGGSRVTFFAADANRNAIANCAEPQVESQCTRLPNITPLPTPLKSGANGATITVNQPVTGQFIVITGMTARAGTCTCSNPATCQ